MGTDRFLLGPAEMVTVRFAIAPGIEGVRAVRRLAGPQAVPLHRALLQRLRRDTPPDVLGILALLAGQRGYTPDFLAQPEETTPEGALAAMATASLDLVERELRHTVAEGRSLPQRWLDDPASARTQISEAWETFWRQAMCPHWPRIYKVLEADIATRSRLLARYGLEAVIEDLDPRLRWHDGVLLRAESRFALETDCRGRGLRLSPTVLGWPRGAITTEQPWTPTIYYPARNATVTFDPEGPDAGRAVGALIGTTRAQILDHLRVPARTSDVAAALAISVPTASHHLHILKEAGLITTQRRGKESWHARTTAPDELGW